MHVNFRDECFEKNINDLLFAELCKEVSEVPGSEPELSMSESESQNSELYIRE